MDADDSSKGRNKLSDVAPTPQSSKREKKKDAAVGSSWVCVHELQELW